MKVVLIGVGQAGGKVTQAIVEFDHEMGFGAVQDAFAVNTAGPDLQALDIDSLLVGQDRVKGHGVGGDNELGTQIIREEATEVMDRLGERITSGAEAVVLVAGLGGGTGSGGSPALAKELRQVYEIPVYVLGVLPGRDEGAIYQVNAGRSLKTVARESDAALLVDNDAWRESGESVEEGFERINEQIARRVGLLLAAGETVDGVAESVVDSSEVINTLRGGGVASLGYATAEASEDAGGNVNTITSLTRNALLTGMSLPDAVDAEAALLVIAGSPERISRKGVERARKWLEEETGSLQVRGGDFPLDTDRLGALVLLGGVERAQRVQEFMDRAREAQDDRGRHQQPAEAFENEELEDLF
jgi:cell division GTPase FtsZ